MRCFLTSKAVKRSAVLVILLFILSAVPSRFSNVGLQAVYAGEVHPSVAGGNRYSLCLSVDGTVWAWGENSCGQLGDGTTSNRAVPVQVKGPNGNEYFTDAVALAAGSYHSLALRSDGTVWAWGSNSSGQLGDGTTTNRTTPVQVKGPNGSGYLTDVVALAAGWDFSLALRSDGSVWAWGNNSYGQLGDGTTTSHTTPVQVKGPNGSGYLTDVVAVAAGYSHSLALRSDGTVWAWGKNTYGRLGDGTTTNRTTPVQVKGPNGNGYLTDVVAVAAGCDFSLALRSDGSVWAWGNNSYGQLGDNTSNSYSTPVQVKGPNGDGYLTGVIGIMTAPGSTSSLAMKADGSIWAWGYNYFGQLGDGTSGTSSNRRTPVQVKGPGGTGNLTGITAIGVGSIHSLAFKSDATVWAWGDNSYGQLGDGTTNSSSYPVQVQLQINVNPPVPVVNSVVVSPSMVSLPKGKSQQLTVIANYSDGSAKDVTNEASYCSSQESVACVSSSGLITAANVGEVTITVGYEGKTATVSVTVTEPVMERLIVQPDTVVVPKGKTQQLITAAIMSDNSTIDVTQSASYISEDPLIASATQNGTVMGIAEGSTTIKVSYRGQTVSVPVTVTAPVVEYLTVEPQNITISVGSAQQVTVYAYLSDGSTIDVTSSASYTLGSDVATVASSGSIVGLAEGATTMSVAYGGQALDVPVTVNAASSPGSGEQGTSGGGTTGGGASEGGTPGGSTPEGSTSGGDTSSGGESGAGQGILVVGKTRPAVSNPTVQGQSRETLLSPMVVAKSRVEAYSPAVVTASRGSGTSATVVGTQRQSQDLHKIPVVSVRSEGQ
ncbi:MAG: Ig-like domain-containing protein [Moorellaceae bacterium]